MNSNQNKLASDTVNSLLCGMVLDSIRVYSAVMLIGFFRPGSLVTQPSEVWISVSGGVRVDPSSHTPKLPMNGVADYKFFTERALVLGELYLLIGKEVFSAYVDGSGSLDVELGQTHIQAYSDGDDLEEVWAVMSDFPDADKDHNWYVSLDDLGHVAVRINGVAMN